MAYLYGYGYLPGIVPQQGIRLSVTYQRKLLKDSIFASPVVSVVPRGLSNNSSLLSHLSLYNDNLTNISFDYGIPVFIGDLSIGGSMLYIKRMVVTPHFDFNIIGARPSLFSTGASLTFDIESVLGITWPFSLGVTYSYNGGFKDCFQTLQKDGLDLGRHFAGPVFNVSF
jgi:hypothetical protein